MRGKRRLPPSFFLANLAFYWICKRLIKRSEGSVSSVLQHKRLQPLPLRYGTASLSPDWLLAVHCIATGVVHLAFKKTHLIFFVSVFLSFCSLQRRRVSPAAPEVSALHFLFKDHVTNEPKRMLTSLKTTYWWALLGRNWLPFGNQQGKTLTDVPGTYRYLVIRGSGAVQKPKSFWFFCCFAPILTLAFQWSHILFA